MKNPHQTTEDGIVMEYHCNYCHDIMCKTEFEESSSGACYTCEELAIAMGIDLDEMYF